MDRIAEAKLHKAPRLCTRCLPVVRVQGRLLLELKISNTQGELLLSNVIMKA